MNIFVTFLPCRCTRRLKEQETQSRNVCKGPNQLQQAGSQQAAPTASGTPGGAEEQGNGEG